MALSLFKKSESRWLIRPAQGLNVAEVGLSTVSAAVNIDGAEVGISTAQVFVLIKNEGDKAIPDLMAVLRAPAGLSIVSADQLFGSAEKRERTGRIRAGQIIRYKIALKSRPEFRGGTVEFELRNPDLAPSDVPIFRISLELQTDRI